MKNSGPGRRKRIPSDPSSCGTPVKITIKRPYLEENGEGETQFGLGRKVEEEMIVNVSSPLTYENGYFNSCDFNKSNESESLVTGRQNGFATSDDKLGFPSMIYTTFSHSPAAVAVSQSFTDGHTPTASPKTTQIQPINSQMSPMEESKYDITKTGNVSQANNSTLAETPSAPHSVTTNHSTPPGIATSPQSSAGYIVNCPPSADATSPAGKAVCDML